MIHTGSRGLGHQVCTDALSACDRWVLMRCSCLQGLGARTVTGFKCTACWWLLRACGRVTSAVRLRVEVLITCNRLVAGPWPAPKSSWWTDSWPACPSAAQRGATTWAPCRPLPTLRLATGGLVQDLLLLLLLLLLPLLSCCSAAAGSSEAQAMARELRSCPPARPTRVAMPLQERSNELCAQGVC